MQIGRAVDALTTRRYAGYAVCCLRALMGVLVLATMVTDHGRRHELFGPDGYYPRDLVRAEMEALGGFNLYLLGDGPLAFELLFHAGMLVALCVVVGVGGRPVLVAHWALTWSLLQTNPMLLDGGDNVTFVVLPMLCLTSCFRHLSLARWVHGPRPERRSPWGAVLVHNVGTLAIALQICIVYVVSGTYKLQGEMWTEGTAVYYVLSVPEFSYPAVTDVLLGWDTGLVLGAYAAVALLVFFPVLVLNAALRPWVVAAMVCFHLSIALLMGLTGFALAMIACDLVFVDRELRTLRRRAGSLLDRCLATVPSSRAAVPAAVAQQAGPAVVREGALT